MATSPTASPARIRRCNRPSEFALVQDASVLVRRPDARPTGQDDTVLDSFFDLSAHAQILLQEKFSILSKERRTEAAECADQLKIGTEIPTSPFLPRVRMIDRERGLDVSMLITGISVDENTDKNSVEATG